MEVYLPTEVLLHIFSFVDVSDKATCAALCATNTLGRDTMRPILYTTIDGGASYGDEERIDVYDRGRQLSLLCRTLVENADLAGLVQHFVHWLDTQVLADRGAGSIESRYIYGMTDIQYEALSPRLKDPSLAPVLQFFKSVNSDGRCSEDMHIVVLLLSCPNLISCTFRGRARTADDMAWLEWLLGLMRSRDAKRSSLCRFRDFRLENEFEAWFPPNIRIIDAAMRLPHLRTFKANGMGRIKLNSLKTLATTNIQHLDFEGTHTNVSRMMRRLSLCPQLTVLTLGGFNIYGEEWQQVGDVLRTYCPLLETLRLPPSACHGEYDPFTFVEADARHHESATGVEYIGSLQTLQHLKHFEASKVDLCGFVPLDRRPAVFANCSYGTNTLLMESVLPASLNYLSISCYTDDQEAVEQALLKQSFITNLKIFAVIGED